MSWHSGLGKFKMQTPEAADSTACRGAPDPAIWKLGSVFVRTAAGDTFCTAFNTQDVMTCVKIYTMCTRRSTHMSEPFDMTAR